MPQNDIYQLSVDQILDDNSFVNVHYFQQNSDDEALPAAQALIQAYRNNVEASQLACQSNDMSIVGYRAIRVFPNPTQADEILAFVPGGLVGEAHPANNSAIVAWYSTEASPVKIGRSFISGIRELDVTKGLITSSLNDVLVIFANNLIQEITSSAGTNFQKVIFNVALNTFADVVQAEVRTRMRKLRSRTKGQGGSVPQLLAQGIGVQAVH